MRFYVFVCIVFEIAFSLQDDTGWWLGKLQKSGVVGWFAPDLVVPENQVDSDDEKGAPYNNSNYNNSNNKNNSNNNSNGTSMNGSANNYNNKSNSSTPKPKANNNNTASKAPKIEEKKTPANAVLAGMGDPNKPVANAGVNETGDIYPYEQLKSRDGLPNSVNLQKLEVYLNDQEFQTVFKMSRDEYYKMPVWKQRRNKKEVGLF